MIGIAVGAAVPVHAADRRMALVIGNGLYPTMPLPNPENDARLMSATLRKVGFDVTEYLNLGARDFRRVLRDFSRRVQNEEGVALLYYAGHGVQIDGRNYLLPVDLNLRDQDEVKDDSVDIEDLFLSKLDRARARTRIVILDACRDNPFAGRTRNLRSVGGLAEMGARGTLIAYASAPGATAEDGAPGTNGVYTRHLAREMLVEGVEIEQMLKSVRVKVLQDTHERQVPWVNTSLLANFSFLPARAPQAADSARQERIERLEKELEHSRRLIEDARQAGRHAADVPKAAPAAVTAPTPVTAPAPVTAPTPTPATAPASSVIAAPARVPERVTAAPADPRERALQCGALLHELSLGVQLTHAARTYLQKECK